MADALVDGLKTRSYEVAVEIARKRVRDQQLRDPRDLE